MPALKLTKNQERNRKITAQFKVALAMKGWTQKHLAKLTGISETFISRIINQPLQRDLLDVLIVADKLGVNLLAVDCRQDGRKEQMYDVV